MTRWGVLQSPIYATLMYCLTQLFAPNRLCKISGFIDSEDSTGTIKKGLWREEGNNGTFQDIGIARPRKYKSFDADTREPLGKYFVSKEGSLPWHRTHIGCCWVVCVHSRCLA